MPAVSQTFWDSVLGSAKAIWAFFIAAASVISTALAVSPTHSLTLIEIGSALLAAVVGHQLVYQTRNVPKPTAGADSVTAGTEPAVIPDVDLSALDEIPTV